MSTIRRSAVILLLCTQLTRAFSTDSIFEPILRPFDFLPEYFLRFDLSTFALHRDAFFRRQYLAEPHPQLEFCFVSYKNIASVWAADFQFGLGQMPGNNVFTVLNVEFGYNPTIEVRLPDATLSVGIPHRCFHEVDNSYFRISYYNQFEIAAQSPQSRINTYWSTMMTDTVLSQHTRYSWKYAARYYIRELFGLADPNKLNGLNQNIWEVSGSCRYAFYRRRSWIVSMTGETTAGTFDRSNGYYTASGSIWYWKQAVGLEAYFIRGKRGGCFWTQYHLDDLPREPDAPVFTLGNSRFSRNGLLEIGVSFFN